MVAPICSPGELHFPGDGSGRGQPGATDLKALLEQAPAEPAPPQAGK